MKLVSIAFSFLIFSAGLPTTVTASPYSNHATQASIFRTGVLDILRTKRVSAAGVAVISRRGVLLSEGYGTLDPNGGMPTNPWTLFRVASVSKTFTTLGVLRLVDAGRVHLDAPLVQYLPWFRLRGGQGDWRRITIRQLMTHTSGINREVGCEFTTSQGEWIPLFDLPSCVVGQETIFAPGTRLKYSNLGMILLGRVIAERGGAPGWTPEERFRNFMVTQVFAPLGMIASDYTLNPAMLTNLSVPLGHLQATGVREVFPKAATTYFSAPAWGVASSANDMQGLLRFILNVLDDKENGVISRGLAREVFKTLIQDRLGDQDMFQGLGFSVRKSGSSYLVGHGGHFPGYTTQMFVDTASGLGIVVMANSIERSAAGDIFNMALKMFGTANLYKRGTEFMDNALEADEQATLNQGKQGANALPWMLDLVGTYRGWPALVQVGVENGQLFAMIGSRKWPLIPSDESGLNFRLDTEGKPNFVAPLGERFIFRRGANGAVVSLMYSGVYEYRKVQ